MTKKFYLALFLIFAIIFAEIFYLNLPKTSPSVRETYARLGFGDFNLCNFKSKIYHDINARDFHPALRDDEICSFAKSELERE